MRLVATKKMAIVVAVAAIMALAGDWFCSLGIPAVAVAQEAKEKNPVEEAPAAAEAAKANGVDAAASQPKGPQNMLTWFFGALGWRYTISFLIISFSFVAFMVMNLLSRSEEHTSELQSLR